MVETYANFFIASAGASAAFSGLLFVAIVVVNTEELDVRTRARVQALSGSAYAHLIDAFVVAMVSLTGDATGFAIANAVMALFGLLVMSQLLPPVIRAGNFARHAPHRTSNIVLPVVSICVYLLQMGFGITILARLPSTDFVRLLVLLNLGLYAGALARAWEITKRS
jgi:hypothetical protein